jgi:hypothetical protein
MPEDKMLPSLNRANLLKLGFAVIFFVSNLVIPRPLPAQERYPTVARISFVSGPVTYSRGDDPDHWDDAIENVPLTIGDRIYSPEDGRAELQLSSGNFVRLAPRSYFSTLNLTDDIKQFYLGEGTASFNIKRLRSDEVIEVDTPNVSVTLDEPGIYRITVDEDGNSRISARRGRVTVAASGRQIDVENREIRVYGIDSPRYEFVGLPAIDPFDRWVADRDQRFERSYADAYRYASDEIIGVEELSDHGRWEQIPEYGYAWTPSNVVAGWVPFSDGRWFWQDPYGWTWISRERWGWATSHYGRWTPYRSRWYWVPVRPRTRVVYAPANVEFVRVRDHVGWFPLHPRDRFIPWWERRDRRPIQNITYVNKTYVTVVNHNTFVSARPIRNHIVRDSVIVREVSSTRVITDSLPIPSRSSLRVVSETGGRRDHRPSDRVLARAAVVRTAPPPAQATFQEKLPEIQKRQGKPLDPSTVVALASQKDETSKQRVRIRPAAVETSGGDFAPRTPGATSGPAPQPLTAARGKKLATRENPVDTKLTERGERGEKSSAQQQPPQPSAAEPGKGVAGKPESQTPEQDRERRRQEKQTPERERQAEQQKQQQLERKQQEQQKDQAREQQKQQRDLERRQQDQERKVELQKQQQDQDRREQQKQKEQERQAREQQKQELERKQQTKQKEEERKAKLQQDQERREQQTQKQTQERQGRELQRQQELERRQQDQQQVQERQAREQREAERGQQAKQKEEERKAKLQQDQERREQQKQKQIQERQGRELERQQELDRRQQQQQLQERQSQQQRQQEQERAQQLRQQQSQERQAREQQRQQELERRQQQQQREQERNAQQQQRQQEQLRREQLRQQQAQERQTQQQQRQQEVERRQQAQQREQEREARQQEQRRQQQARQQQLQDRQAQEQPRAPGQPPQELVR